MLSELVIASRLKNNNGQVPGLPKNPRLIKDDRFDKLKKSIQDDPEMLELREVIAYEFNGELVVIAGNMRLKACIDLGIKEVPTKILPTDTPIEKLKAYTIKDNVPFGENDWEAIVADWPEAVSWGLDLPAWATKNEAVEDDYEIPAEIDTDIVLGDLFEIGEHRLVCGSSTESDVVAKVLNGKEPYLMVTDPPYGVSYDPQWRNDHNIKSGVGANRATGKVQNDDEADWTPAWALSPSRVAYVWHGGKHSAVVQTSIESADFIIRAQIIWAKQNLVMSRGDYHWQHEPCWYAVKKGSKGNWASDRKQTTLWNISNNNPFGNQKKEEQTGHGTQKPVECMARPISHHDGDVYDPFIGSGTTMVAAHQLNRKCYGIEIDPKYCQVIVDRMRKLAPELPIKKNGVPLDVTDEKQTNGIPK